MLSCVILETFVLFCVLRFQVLFHFQCRQLQFCKVQEKCDAMYSAVLKCTGRVNILGGVLGEELYSCALQCCYCGCEIRCITVGKVQGVIQWVVGEVQYSGWGSGYLQ